MSFSWISNALAILDLTTTKSSPLDINKLGDRKAHTYAGSDHDFAVEFGLGARSVTLVAPQTPVGFPVFALTSLVAHSISALPPDRGDICRM